MKNQYDLLNKIKDNETYEEVKLSDKEKSEINERVLSKINKSKKRNNKHKVAIACSICICLFIGMTNQNVLASIQDIGKSIESFFDFGDNKNTTDTTMNQDYKTQVLSEVNDQGIKFIVNEATTIDDELLISTTVDFSEIKSKNKDIKRHMIPIIDVNIMSNNEYQKVKGVGTTYNYHEDKDVVDILIKRNIEGIFNDDIYTITLNINTMESNKGKDIVINGNWNTSFDIRTEISQEKTKTIKIDKSLELKYKGVTAESTINDLVVSPLRISLKTKDEFYDDRHIFYELFDQDGNEILGTGGGGSDEGITSRYITHTGITSIKIVPTVYMYKSEKTKTFEEQAIVVNLE
ncbi:MAG: DUF4179 domain-containing protein [Clostridium sp.]